MSTIRLKRSAEPKKVPSLEQLELGEIAVNTYDGKMFLKREQDGELQIREFGARDAADNVFYVTMNGSNENDGKTIGDAFATIDHALKNIPEGSTLYVKAGQHTVDNPVKLPAFVAIVGDSLRTSFVQPKNPDKDIFWVNNGCFLKDMRFNNYIAPSAAVSFPPDGSAGSIMCSPYVQNCTSYTTTGTGMRVDGSVVTGLRSMVVDAYTQYNQGGIGVHHLNRGNTQLVSIFTISCDISILCESGGFCSLTNSNTSFGNYGLISDGYSEALFSASAGAIQSRNSMIFNDLVNIPYIQNAAVFSDTDAVYTIKDATPIKVGQGIVTGPTFTNQDDARTTARSLILAEKERIQKATVDFVKNTYQTGAGFDEDKCARDSVLILEGAGYDRELVTNYNAVTNGLAYQRANSKFVISNQLDATLGAIGYLRDATDSAFAGEGLNDAYFNTVIDLIGEGSLDPTYTTPTLTFANPDNPFARAENVKDALQASKEWWAYELELWIAAQTGGIWDTFDDTYDRAKCRRDVEFLIDAVTYDLMYGGDSAIKTAIESYFVGAALDQLPEGQVAGTAAAYNQLATYLETYISSGSLPNNDVNNPASAPPSITGGFDADTTTISASVKASIDLVATTITAGTLDGLTATVYPDLSALVNAIDIDANDENDAVYNETTGVLTIKSTSHGLVTGQAVRLAEGSLEFTCAYDPTVPVSYPNASSPALSTPLTVTVSDVNTFSVNIGPATGDAAGSAHTFVPGNSTLVGAFTVADKDQIDVNIGNILDGDTSLTGTFNKADGTTLIDDVTFAIGLFKFINTQFNFTFDQTKCARDIGFILDAVAHDVALGSTYRSYTQGLSYSRANADYLITNQQEQTAQAIEYIRDEVLVALEADADVTTATRNEYLANFTIILDLLRNKDTSVYKEGTDSVNNYPLSVTWTAPTASVDTTFVDAGTQLFDNRAYIQMAVLQFIKDYYNDVYAGSMNKASCIRDTGFIVDALRYDLTYGVTNTGNAATYDAALAYYVGATLQLGDDEKTATLDAFAFLGDVAKYVIQAGADSTVSDTFAATTGSIDLTSFTIDTDVVNLVDATYAATVTGSKVNAGDAAATTAAARADTLANIVVDYINDGDTLPVSRTEPNVAALTTGAEQSQTDAFDIIQDSTRRTQLLQDVIVFVEKNFRLLDFNQSKCYRDTGIIIEAAVDDMVLGTNYKSIVAGRLYSQNSAALVISDQKVETIAAVEFVKDEIDAIGVTTTEEATVLANIDIVIDHITNGKKVTEKFTPYAADYDPSINNDLKLYIGDHNFTTDDSIVIEENSLTFTCPSGGGSQTIVHPRSNTGDSAGGALTGNPDPAFRTALPITSADQEAGWIVVDLGVVPAGAQVTHTFVSATPGAVSDANGYVLFDNPNLVLPEVVNAKESIIKNRAYLVEEAVAFINKNYPLLGYNRETCERDVGLVIDALTYDFMFNSNFRSITAGRSYLRGALKGVNADRPLLVTESGIKGQLITSDETTTTLNVGSSAETVTVDETTSYGGYGGTVSVSKSVVVSDTVVPAEQKAATVSAFLHLKDMMKQMVSQPDAVQRIEDNMAIIVNIIQDGAIAVPDTPLLTTPANTDATKIVGTAGEATIAQTINNITKNRNFLIADTKAFIELEFPTVSDTYDDDGKCTRDLGFLLDAITYDLTYGGNLETSVAAQAYFSDVVAAADGSVDKLGNISVEVEVDDTRFESEGVIGVDLNKTDPNATVRITTKTPHGLRDGYTVTLFDINGPIRLNAADFFVKVVDSITFDIYEESTLTTPIDTTLGYTDYVNRGKVRVNNAEVIATVESYKHLATIIRTVAEGTAITATTGNAETQVTDATATSSDANVRSGSLIQDVVTTIENDSSNPAEELPVLEWVDGYSTQVYPVGFANASLYGDYQVLQGEKEDLQAAVTTYIEANFAYDKATCRRDLGFFIEAALYDGLYRGNSQSVEAAKQYRVSGKLQIPELQKRATGDALEHLGDRVGDVLRANRVAPTQDIEAPGYVVQDTTTPATTITEILRIQQNFTDAASVVRRDYFINDFIDVIDPDFVNQSKDGQEIKAKILAEKENLQVKTIKFIDNTFREFRFNREVCSRDVGLIIDAVAMDTVLGTNYNAIIAGLSYQRGSLSIGTVKDEQKPQTLAAIEFLKSETLAISGLSATGIARATAAFDEILDIFENGSTSTRTAADAIVFDKTAAAGNSDQRKAHDLLIANRDLLSEEIISWLDEQFTNFEYDEDKCLRDTKLIIEALAVDNVLNTNYNTVTVGLSYQRANASEVLTGQKIQTIAAVEHLKERIDELTTLSTQGRARTKRLLDTLLDILGGAFSYDSSYDSTDDAGAVENIEFVNPGSATQDQIDTKDQLRLNRSFLSTEVVAYIDATFPSLDYVKSRCKRDVGFIIDAISYDMLYGGNSATTQAARSYFVDGLEQLGYDEGTATIAGYERLKVVIEPVVLAQSVGNQPTFPKTPGNGLTQIVESDAGSAENVTRLQELVDIIIDVIRVGNLTGVPAETRPSITWADANLREDMLAFGVAAARSEFTPYGADYDPTTGIMELSIGMHPFVEGDKISIEEGALAFTCASDGNEAILYHPRSTDTVAFGNLLSVLEVSPTTITINVGISTETSDHTFVSARNNSVTVTGKTGVADQVIEYINDEFVNFTYDIDKCARDVKLITEGVAKDIALQTNYNSVISGISYLRANASKVQNAMQKAITVAAFTKLKELITATATLTDATLATEAGTRVDTVISLFNNGGTAPALTFTSNGTADRVTARTAIQSNRDALIANTITYIESNTALVGAYDQTKCARDTLTILDAVTRDMVLNTNYHSVYAGISYLRASNTELLSSNQKNATIQSLTYLKTKTLELSDVAFKASDRTANTDAVARLTSAFDEVIDIITNGTQSTTVPGDGTADALDFSNAPATLPTAQAVEAAERLQTNRAYLVEHIRAHNVTVNGQADGVNGYDEAKCERDTGYIIDGVTHDVLFGGNIGARLNAAAYFEGTSLDQLPATQIAFTSAAYAVLATAVDNVIRNIDITEYASHNGAITQDIAGTPGTVTEAARATNLVNIIKTVVDAGSLTEGASNAYANVIGGNAESGKEIEPSITWADADLRGAYAEIKQEETSLVDQTIAFINADLSYDQARCERDTGIILDALSYDVNYGGDSASKVAALAYFVGTASQLGTSSVEKTASLAAFANLKTLLAAVSSPSAIPAGQLTEAESYIDALVSYIENGKTFTPATATYNDTSADAAYGELTIDLGEDAATAGFVVGGRVSLAAESLTFSCTSGGLGNVSYPALGQSAAYEKSVAIERVSGNTITVYVGGAGSAADSSHTFVSAAADAVTLLPEVNKLFTTAPSVTWSTANRQAVHTALRAARNTYASSVNAYTLATFPANTYDRTRCQRDVGFIVDALAYDVLYGGNSATREVARSYFSFALSQLGGTADESKETRATLLAYDRLSDAVGTVTQGLALSLSTKANAAANITPYNAAYTPTTGVMVLSIGTHTFAVGDEIQIKPGALAFTCASDSNVDILRHPRVSDTAAYQTDLAITAVTDDTITVNVGISSETSAHTFRGAVEGAITSAKVVQTTTNPANAIEAAGVQSTLKIVTDVIRNGGVQKLDDQVLPVITNSSLALQNDFSSIVANRTVAQESTLQFIDDRYTTFSYDQFKCSRDIALILDAVLSDTVLGGNYQSLLAGSSYYRASASIVFEDQLPETIRAIEFLRDEVKKVLTDPLFTATVAPGTYATPATRAITPVEAVENAKTSGKVYTGTPELARLEARFADVLRTMEFGLVTNMTVNTPITLVKGEVISQEGSRATAVVKTAVENSTEVELISVSGTFNTTNTIVGSRSGATGVEPVQTTLSELDTISYNDELVGITEDRKQAKNILEANKEFFVAEAVAFIKETFPMLGYDRATCERDVSLVLDAVGYDLMFGSNFRSIVAGRSYSRKGAEIVTKEQKKATLAAFQFIKTIAADAISSPLLSAAGFVAPQNKYTPQAATSFFTPVDGEYDPATGVLILEFADDHGLTAGSSINIAPESVSFTCDYDNDTVALAYPDKDSSAYKTPVSIIDDGSGALADTKKLSVNVGTIASGPASTATHTFASAKANGITVGGSTYYDVDTGDMMLDLGENATAAGFEVGQDVRFADNSLTFTCEYDVNTPLTYPAKESTYFQAPVRITEVNGTTITVNVGPAINAAEGSVHTFISSTADSIIKGEARSEFIITVQEDSYTLSKTGSFHIDGVEKPVMQLLPGRVYEFNQDDISNVYYGDLRHPMVFGDIRDGNLTVGGNPYKTGVTYLLDDVSVPLESYIRDFANSTTRRVRLDLTASYTTEIWYHSAKNAGMGNQIYTQATGFENDKGAKLRLQNAMNTIIDILDTGADTTLQLSSPVKFAKGTIITQENTGVEGEVTSCDGTSVTMINVDGGKKMTVDAATTYDVDTGVLTVTTSAAHGLSDGTKVLIRAGSLAFSCSSPGLGTLNYPDESSPAFNTPVAIFNASGSTFDINIGPATGAAAGQAHTFESGSSSLTDAISVAQFSLTDNLLVGSVDQNTRPTAVSSPPLPILPTPTTGTASTAGVADIATTVNNIESNRQYIVEEVQAYITENYPLLGFDRATCARDTGLVIDALAWDLLNGSEDGLFTQDWRSTTAARSYVRQAVNALPTGQVAATQAGFTHLGELLEALITSTTGAADKAKLQLRNNIELINSVIAGGAVPSRTLATPAAFVDADIAKTFTAGAGTTYAHLTGDMTIEIGAHNLSVGMEVAIKTNGITFECDSGSGPGNESYPNATTGPFAVEKYLTIKAVTATTITVFVGVATGTAAVEHTFVSGVADAIVPRALAANQTATSLVANRQYIQEQVNEWIKARISANDTVSDPDGVYADGDFSDVTFQNEYDATAETQCKNDVGLIVDALTYDVTFGGNLETKIAAEAYFSGAVSQIDNEATQTVQAYLELKNTIIPDVLAGTHTKLGTGVDADTATTVEFIEPNTNEISNKIINIADEISSDGFRDIIPVYPQRFGTTFGLATFNQFISERGDIVPLVTEYIEDNFAYLENKCRRDVNYILDAIRYDLTYGGTMESEIAARSYYSDEGVNKLNSIDEINATKDAYAKLADIVEDLGNGASALTSLQTTANNYASNSAIAGTTLTVVDSGGGGSDPAYDFETGLLTLETSAAHGLAPGDKIVLATESIGFTCLYEGNTTALKYPDTDAFAYQRELTCMTGTTSNTIIVNVGRAVYPANNAHTYNSAASTLADAVTIVANGKLVKSEATPTVPSDTSHATRAHDLIESMVSFIDNTLGDTTSEFDTGGTTPSTLAVTSWVDADLVAANTTLQTEKAKIQALTTEFIEAFHAYKQSKCERDVRYIVDSVCYDLFYLGNSQVHLAAEQYFDGGNLQIPVPTKQATVDTFRYIQLLAEDVVRNVEVLALQTRVKQDRTLTDLSDAPAQAARITELFKVVNNLIQHGYSSTVTFDINMTELPKIGETATFHQTSLITASGQTFEWVGSGTNIQQAVPYRGGQPIQDQQVVESNEGKVYFTSTDQTGDFKIGNSLTIERATGTITGDTFDRSLFAVLTPYILSLQ